MTIFDIIYEQMKQAGVRYLLVGGNAANAYGVDRFTDDVDVFIEDHTADRAVAALARYGYREGTRSPLVSRLRPGDPTLPIVDLIFADAATFNRMWSERCELPWGAHVQPFPAPMHLIAMKLHALQHGHEGRRVKDAGDILEIARLRGIDLQGPDFRDACLKYASQRVYEYLKKLSGGP
jgi:hypothetical protein